jgi:hypothetical protein
MPPFPITSDQQIRVSGERWGLELYAGDAWEVVKKQSEAACALPLHGRDIKEGGCNRRLT